MKRDEKTLAGSDLSPIAKVVLGLALGVPLTFSYAALSLGGDTATWLSKLQRLVPIAGVVASAAVAALFWKRVPALRFAPVAYAVPLALSVTVDTVQVDLRTVVEGIAAGLIIGFGIMFAIWIETKDAATG